jgi:AcrR family transcriptional regulator
MSVADMTKILYNSSDVNDCHWSFWNMSRWEPNAKGRLEQAALDLYHERGYEQTTVTDIAERARLTERTFFRYFADKREVLFGWQEDLLKTCVAAIETAPKNSTPIEMTMDALEAVVPMFQERHASIRQRQSVIVANPALQERELLKLATLTNAMTEALRKREVADLAASLATNIADLVFKTAYARWVAGSDMQDLSSLIRASFEQLKRIMSD